MNLDVRPSIAADVTAAIGLLERATNEWSDQIGDMPKEYDDKNDRDGYYALIAINTLLIRLSDGFQP